MISSFTKHNKIQWLLSVGMQNIFMINECRFEKAHFIPTLHTSLLFENIHLPRESHFTYNSELRKDNLQKK